LPIYYKICALAAFFITASLISALINYLREKLDWPFAITPKYVRKIPAIK
jgi:hypothetical protein